MANDQRDDKDDRGEGSDYSDLPRFSGDMAGGGESQDADLGRGGSSTPTGDVGTGMRRESWPKTPDEVKGSPGNIEEQRSTTNMVPGVPEGDGSVPELEPLEGTKPEHKPKPDQVRREDRDRTTL